MRPTSHALRRTASGQSPSRSYSQATGRISLAAKSCAISRSAFCSSVRVKSTTFRAPRLTGQSTTAPGRVPDGVSVHAGTRRMGDHRDMDDAVIAVVVLVSVLALVGAVIALATSGGSYDEIGRGGLSVDEPPATTAQRDTEIRQYLAARNARRAAR